jgi:Flp pilus assembly protein TadG
MKRNCSRKRGQTLVEWALVLPVLLLIVLVVLDLGRAVYYYSVVHNAAREGARYGSIHPTDEDGIRTTTRDKAIGLNPSDVNVNIEQVGTIPFVKIRVSVTYNFVPVTPMVANLTGSGGFMLTTESRMKIEQ